MKIGQEVLINGILKGTILQITKDQAGNTVCLVDCGDEYPLVHALESSCEPIKENSISDWEIARELFSDSDTVKTLCTSLNMQPVEVLNTFTPEEIKEKLEKIENSVKVDDFVHFSESGRKIFAVVTNIDKELNAAVVLQTDGKFNLVSLKHLHKTNHVIKIMDFFSEALQQIENDKRSKKSRYKNNEKLCAEYREFILSEEGKKWRQNWQKKYSEPLDILNAGDFGDYLYDFHPELLQ